MKEELIITREMIVHDHRFPHELDAAREDADNNISRLQLEINDLCERIEMFDELRSLSGQVEGVTPEGVPYWDSCNGDYEEVAEYNVDVRSAALMKRAPSGMMCSIDRTMIGQFSYVFSTDEGEIYGEHDNWTDIDYVRSLAIDYIGSGRLPAKTEQRWYLVWGHTNNWGWKEVGKFELGPDRAEAEVALSRAVEMAIGEFDYRLEVINV